MISSILILSKLDHPKPNVLDMYYLGSLPGITLEYHLNSLMYQQHTSPVLIWSNLFLDLFETLRFHVRPGLGTQPHYEAPGDLRVEYAKTQ